VQILAAQALGNIGPAAKEAVPALQSMLETPNLELRAYVMLALAQVTGEKDEYVSELSSILLRGDSQERAAAATCLSCKGLRSGHVNVLLIRGMKDTDRYVAAMCQSALVERARWDDSVVDALLGALNESCSQNMIEALETLGAIGEKAERAVPLLERLSQTADEATRRFAIESLAKIRACRGAR
jgi:HEAT repeat protein